MELNKKNIIKNIKMVLRTIVFFGALLSIMLSLINICFVGSKLNISTDKMIIYFLLLFANVFIIIDYVALFFDGKVKIDG